MYKDVNEVALEEAEETKRAPVGVGQQRAHAGKT